MYIGVQLIYIYIAIIFEIESSKYHYNIIYNVAFVPWTFILFLLLFSLIFMEISAQC